MSAIEARRRNALETTDTFLSSLIAAHPDTPMILIGISPLRHWELTWVSTHGAESGILSSPSTHRGHRRIVVDAGVVDDDLDRSADEQRFKRLRCRCAIGDIECDRRCTSAACADFIDDGLRALEMGVRMDDDLATGRGQGPRDGAADVATAAGNEGSAG